MIQFVLEAAEKEGWISAGLNERQADWLDSDSRKPEDKESLD